MHECEQSFPNCSGLLNPYLGPILQSGPSSIDMCGCVAPLATSKGLREDLMMAVVNLAVIVVMIRMTMAMVPNGMLQKVRVVETTECT